MSGRAADDPHRRLQNARGSGLDVASFDHCDISAEVGVFNKKLKFEVSVSHRSGAVAALEGAKKVTEHVVRFVCDMLETGGSGVCVLECQNEPAVIALQNAVVRTRQFKTIPRNTPRYLHGSLGRWESAIKEVEKQMCVTFLVVSNAEHSIPWAMTLWKLSRQPGFPGVQQLSREIEQSL